MGQGSAEWFSKFLGQEVRLLQHLPNFKMRPTERSTTSGKMNDHKVPIMFQDACPVYLITEASIESANVLREEGSTWHFDHASFRPNIVVEDSGADEEENWECLRINQIVFKNVRISDKCAVTTVDKERGVKDDSRLDVLKKRRKVTSQYEKKNYSGDKALFGINLAPDSSGLIKRGMKIDVSLKQATS